MTSSDSKPRHKRSRVSAGLLMYRVRDGRLEVFLAHPGGPFFVNKDDGAWGIPKGEPEPGDDLLTTALREFHEETGLEAKGEVLPLGSIKQRGGKTVHAWAFEGEYDESQPIRSNLFTIEWPPRSGRQQEFPEADRAAFFDVDTAKRKIKPAQDELIDRLQALLGT